eukprot:TRINITY_DN24251_c0_g1_i1.p1 TRINITY_DN24251_c0_g1~~TRINITY_DN24251_c0_g1_i1.p1  ORF type:complete len:583 (-),score=33.57 TRINITY_DN24251_c0_g1_i1:161-1909(-)
MQRRRTWLLVRKAFCVFVQPNYGFPSAFSVSGRCTRGLSVIGAPSLQIPSCSRQSERADYVKTIEAATSSEQLFRILCETAETLQPEVATAALRTLPRLLADDVLCEGPFHGPEEWLDHRLADGLPIQLDGFPEVLPDGPTATSVAHGAEAFLYVHACVERVLADEHTRAEAPLSWLSDVAVFYGTLMPGHRSTDCNLRLCADEGLRRLQKLAHREHDGKYALKLSLLCRLARGTSMMANARRHQMYSMLPDLLATYITNSPPNMCEYESHSLEEIKLRWQDVHDCALALARLRPWNDEVARAAATLLRALPQLPAQPPIAAVAPCPHPPPVAAATTRAGAATDSLKEWNHDAYLVTLMSGRGAVVASVIDGHGDHGARVSTHVQTLLGEALPRVPPGAATAQILKDALLAADTDLLLQESLDTSLSGAACAILLIDKLVDSCSTLGWRLTVAHIGDCRVVLGRVETNAEKVSTVRAFPLTTDHKPDEITEAARIIKAGGCVKLHRRKGPARVWSRWTEGVPGLSYSRGLGDSVGQCAGISVEASVASMVLDAPASKDAVQVPVLLFSVQTAYLRFCPIPQS